MNTPLTRKTKTGLVLMLFLILATLQPALASTGSIHTDDKWAWSENGGWVNFRPAHGGVSVYGTHLAGYAWVENIGWIKLGSDGGGPYANTGPGDWGVNADGAGNLSGYAWSENAGWINFNPAHGRVTLDVATGSFDGYAWAENTGWIHFKNAAPAYNVLTPRLGIADVSVAENAGPAGFTVTLSRATGVDVGFNYATADGTAVAGSDYGAASGSVVIAAGNTTAAVNVALIDDAQVNEPDETFTANLSNAGGASFADAAATGTITDDDTDTDNDGMPDGWETANGLDPAVNDAAVDADGDGLGNLGEYQGQTDPQNPDSDADGMPDGWETTNGLDPTVNDAAGDADGDGFTNLAEYTFGSDPQNAGALPPAPIADAGPDRNVAPGDAVSLNGAGSADPGGAIVAYLWAQTGGSAVTFSDAAAVSPTFTAPGAGTEALTFRLAVTDADGLTAADTCIVNVIDGALTPPIAHAGADRTVNENVAVTLDGSGSSDADGTVAAYLWEQTGGGAVALSDAAAVAPSFTTPAAGTQVLTFLLTVTDNDGLKGTDTCLVNVTATANTAPTANAGPDQTVTEGGTVTLDGTGSTDPQDGGATAFLWTQTTGLPVTLSDTTAAGPTFVTPSVDAAGAVLTFRLTVTDSGGLKAVDEVAVTVNDNAISGFPDGAVPFTASTGEDISIRVTSGGALTRLAPVDPATIAATANRPGNLVCGLIDFQVKVPAPGDTAVVTLYLPVPAGHAWYKYSAANGWTDFSANAVVNGARDQVTLTLTDGGVGDDDGTANGIIVDPSGPGSAPAGGGSVASGGGCFIATAAYGSRFEPQVKILRQFRDAFLLKNSTGRAFVRLYYKYSPPLADVIAGRDTLRTAVRLGLLPAVGLGWVALKIGPAGSAVLVLLFGFALAGLAGYRKKTRGSRLHP